MDWVHETMDHNGRSPWWTTGGAAEGLIGARARGRSGERELIVILNFISRI
jgi:hypothetical protein